MEQKELERSVLTSVFKDTVLIDELMENVTVDHFTDSLSQKVFQWIKKRYNQNKNISVAQLSRADIDGARDLLDHTHILKEFSVLLKLLHKDYTKRKIKKTAQKIVTNVLTNEELSAEEMQNRSQELMFRATTDLDTEQTIYTLEDALTESYESIVEQGKDTEVKGLPLSPQFPTIDSIMGGLHDGHLTTLAGQTSMGKTAFALNVAYNSIKQDNRVMMMSLEMEKREIADRLLVMDSRIDGSDFNTVVEEWQMKNITEAMNRLYDKDMIISDKRGLNASDIKAKCRKEHRKEELDLIIIDYLQMIRLPQGKENSARKVGKVVLQLRELAGELNVPIILLSQLNRGVEGRPKLEHLRDSGNIEEFSDEVWFLHRELYDEAEQPDRQLAELLLKKGRTTGTGIVNLYWYPKYQLFRDKFIEDQEGAL